MAFQRAIHQLFLISKGFPPLLIKTFHICVYKKSQHKTVHIDYADFYCRHSVVQLPVWGITGANPKCFVTFVFQGINSLILVKHLCWLVSTKLWEKDSGLTDFNLLVIITETFCAWGTLTSANISRLGILSAAPDGLFSWLILNARRTSVSAASRSFLTFVNSSTRKKTHG